jgi:hypothetical protein
VLAAAARWGSLMHAPLIGASVVTAQPHADDIDRADFGERFAPWVTPSAPWRARRAYVGGAPAAQALLRG